MSEIDKIVDFIIENSPYFDREKIKDYINQHLKYGTCDYSFKDGEVAYVCRWNIQGKTAKILDLIISPKFRKKGIIKMILQKNLERFPYIKFLCWERQTKYPSRELRVYNVSKMLGRK